MRGVAITYAALLEPMRVIHMQIACADDGESHFGNMCTSGTPRGAGWNSKIVHEFACGAPRPEMVSAIVIADVSIVIS